MLLAGNIAAVTSRVALCCHLFASIRISLRKGATTAERSVVKRLTTVGIEVLTAVVMKSAIIWDITPHSTLDVN
jgi:hypothetical protein